MQKKATHWTMRVSPQDKKMIAAVAKHFRCKQAQIVRVVFRELHALQIAGKAKSPVA